MNGHKKKLNIAIIFDAPLPAIWQANILRQINASTYACLKMVIMADMPDTNKADNNHYDLLLFSLYQRMEKKRWPELDDLTEFEQDNSAIADLDVIKLSLSSPHESDISDLKSYELDVILNFTQADIAQTISGCARAGSWAWFYGNGVEHHHQLPVGFWESYSGSATMGAMLVASFYDSSKNQMLYHSVFASSDRSSAFLNQKQAHQISVGKTVEMLGLLFTLGDKKLFELYPQGQSIKKSHHLSRPGRQGSPSNIQMTAFFAKKLLNSVKMRFMRIFFSEEWTMRFKLADGMSKEFGKFKKLAPEPGGLWADPFIIFDQEQYYLFFENGLTDKENADISVLTINKNGQMSKPKNCLVKPYHLSYPHVFFWEGDYYMMPETKGNKTIEVYKATQFPEQWEFHSNLMENVEAVDTTLTFYNGRWWMFTSIKSQAGVSINNELSIFYSDSPLSQNWTAHSMNPVLSDVRNSRPAGRVFEKEGKLIRPAQDASVRYGYGFRFNEIEKLTETEYKEKEIELIEPTWASLLTGTHTFAHEKDLTVIDVLEWRPRFFK